LKYNIASGLNRNVFLLRKLSPIRLFFAIILFAVVGLLNGCGTQALISYPKSKITIPLKEKVVFENDTIEIDEFILSPLDDNFIWTFNAEGYAYELNLKDNSWRRLDFMFSKYAFHLKKDAISRDATNPDLLWLSTDSQGLAAFRISDRHLTEFPGIRRVTSLCFLEHDIFIGTENGLFRINRINLAPIVIKDLAELPVISIFKRQDNTLQINESYFYNFGKDIHTGSYQNTSLTDTRKTGELILCLSDAQMLYILRGSDTLNSTNYKNNSLENITADENYIWIPDDLKTGIMRYSIANNSFEMVRIGYDYRDYKVSAADSLIWFLNREGFMVFNKNDLNTYRVFLEDTSPYNGLYADSAYLIVSTDNNISIFRKDFLLSHRKNVKQLVLEETPFFSEVSDLISTFKGDFRDSQIKYSEINQKYSANPNTRVRQKLTELKESLITLLPNSLYTSKDLEKYLTDTIRDEYITANYYLHMVKQAIYEGKLKEALHYDSLVMADYPKMRTPTYKTQIAEVRRADEVHTMINKSGVPEDEKLWETGSMYYQLHRIAGPKGKNGINMTYPFSFLKRLKNKYPESQFADNAEFLMIRHVEEELLAAGDEKMIQKVIAEYHALLKKYPHSDVSPDMYHRLAWLYFNVETDVPVKLMNLELARECINKILSEYPAYPVNHSLDGLDKQINIALDKANWELKLILDKRTYNLNEPVVITFELKNTDSKAKPVSIPQNNLPGFALNIERYDLFSDYYYAPAVFEPDYREFDKNTKDTLIEQNRKYTEKWNIMTTARSSTMTPPGKFVLTQEGRYKITAKPADSTYNGFLESNTIWITIRDTSKDKAKGKTSIP
jgi:hypothetical protein